MRTALIDADILTYQAAAATEQATDWGDGLWTLHAFEKDAIDAFESTLKSILTKVDTTRYLMALSSPDNWRKDVLPTYKSNRSGVRKPMLLKFLRQYAIDNHKAVIMPTLEGDDVLGIWATDGEIKNPIVCSIDKDFKTIPGEHYNFGRDESFTISPEEADYWHLHQTLTGDATDGYAGCPGCGPKTAEKVLNPEATWDAVVAAYRKAGFGEEEALTQARVARILRSSDYDHITKTVKLWTPNSSAAPTQ